MDNNNFTPATYYSSGDNSKLIIIFIGVTVLLGMAFSGFALCFVLWKNEQRELAVITALISTIGNAISLGIGVLIPSPVSQGRRAVDHDGATGKPNDPVNITAAPPQPPVEETPTAVEEETENVKQ